MRTVLKLTSRCSDIKFRTHRANLLSCWLLPTCIAATRSGSYPLTASKIIHDIFYSGTHLVDSTPVL